MVGEHKRGARARVRSPARLYTYTVLYYRDLVIQSRQRKGKQNGVDIQASRWAYMFFTANGISQEARPSQRPAQRCFNMELYTQQNHTRSTAFINPTFAKLLHAHAPCACNTNTACRIYLNHLQSLLIIFHQCWSFMYRFNGEGN